MKYNTDTARSA